MNLLTKQQDIFTPEERVSARRDSTGKVCSTKDRIQTDVEKAINALIKSRTQKLQQAVLDGFLGVDDSDPFRITRLIKKLIVHKPDIAVRLLAKILPSISDQDLQRNLPQAQATINIINNNSSSSSSNDNLPLVELDPEETYESRKLDNPKQIKLSPTKLSLTKYGNVPEKTITLKTRNIELEDLENV